MVGFVLRDRTRTYQLICVESAHGRVLLDHVVHDGLRVARFVAFVVSVTAIADQVDDDVLVEGRSILDGEPRTARHRLRIVAVDVEDGCLDGLGDVGGVEGRARLRWVRGEADLVVDDEVDGAASPVARQLREVERLGDDALAGERSVAVDEDPEDTELVERATLILERAHHAFDDGIDRFEVRGVGCERDGQLAAARSAIVSLETLVILDVARALHARGVEVAFELGEDRAIGLADDVRQHVQAPAMRHADDGCVCPRLGGVIEDLPEEHDGRLATFQTEALLADVARRQELLERLGVVQGCEDAELVILREGLVRALDPLLDPELLVRALDVHELVADGLAVGIAQHLEDGFEGRLTPWDEPFSEEGSGEIPQRESVGCRIEFGAHGGTGQVQRIERREQMPTNPIVVDQALDVDLLGEPLGRVGLHAGVVGLPPHGRVGNLECREDLVVEVLFSFEESGDRREELPRLGALNDAMVVRRGEGDRPRDTEFAEESWVCSLECGGVGDGPDANDHPLTGHETRD